jgi:two-component system response regulator HydG
MSDRILIVDDEIAVLNVAGKMLAKEGYQIFTADSAHKAMDIWHLNKEPGIVLTDLKLGGDMDGVALCSKIRYESPRTIVIAMTGHSDEYQLAYCRGVGFSDVLEKPICHADLLDSIRCASQQRARWKNML